MTLVRKLVREPNLILGVLTAALSLAVLFGVDLTPEQLAGIGVFVGALVALVRFATTPAAEVVAQLKPGETTPEAGSAAPVQNGTPVLVTKLDGTPLV